MDTDFTTRPSESATTPAGAAGEGTPSPQPAAKDSRGTKPSRNRRSRVDEAKRREKATARRICSKHSQLLDIDAEQRELLAALLGCKPDPATLTVEIMTGQSNGIPALKDLNELRDADDMQAGILAASWDRHQLRAVHKLLAGLDAEVPDQLPNNEVKAAMVVAAAAKGMAPTQADALQAVTGLLARS